MNIEDITIVAVGYSSQPGDSNWNAAADLYNDHRINIIDITLVAKDYGKTF